MPETPKSDTQEFNNFVKKYNLDPLNNTAIMNCLYELNQKIDKIEER